MSNLTWFNIIAAVLSVVFAILALEYGSVMCGIGSVLAFVAIRSGEKSD